jgi:hypothetical protein
LAQPKLSGLSPQVDLGGGAFSGFRLLQDGPAGVNPLTWSAPAAGVTKPQPMGHFLCCDRWGQPSQAELANGMPFHGEAAQVVWAAGEVSGTAASMSAALPMAGMTVARTVALTGPTSPGRSNHSDTTL